MGTMTKEQRAKARVEAQKAKNDAKKIKRSATTATTKPAKAGDNQITAPTTEVAAQMQEAFDFLNHSLFGGNLPPVMMAWTRLKKAHGYFWAKTWTRKGEKTRGVHEIALDPYRCSQEKDKDVLGTLAHEMVHELDEEEGTAPKRPYHTKIWAERMKAIGLYPSTTAAPGGKETGPNCSHYIIEGGLFDKAADDLLAKGFKFTWTTLPLPEKAKGRRKRRLERRQSMNARSVVPPHGASRLCTFIAGIARSAWCAPTRTTTKGKKTKTPQCTPQNRGRWIF